MIKPIDYKGYQLMHEGSLALSQVEANGIRVDVEYCNRQSIFLDAKIRRLTKEIEDSEIGKCWKTLYGSKFNSGSGEQLAKVLFSELGYKPVIFTASGAASYSQEALEHIKDPVVDAFHLCKKYEKVKNTYLRNFLIESVDGIMHPSFNLHLVVSHRSSCDKPNFQNIPVRDPVIAKITRNAIIPREGHRIVEVDYSGAEVSVAACYHKDPVMMTYLEDKSKDMHRDMASQIFCMPQEAVTKQIRYAAKNSFVFPAFYGSWYKQMAPALWEYKDEKASTGFYVHEYLANKGIVKLGNLEAKVMESGTFSDHMRIVDNDFWNNRFGVYKKWKDDFYSEYLKNGYFKSHTGFVYKGYFDRKAVINYPVQGSAFHCLLWTLIHVQKEMQARKMKSMIVGQIHDSIVADVAENEYNEYIEIVRHFATKGIKEVWEWLIIDLGVEIDASDVNMSWYHKKGV